MCYSYDEGRFFMKLSNEHKAIVETILCFIFMLIGFIIQKNQLSFYPVIFILAILIGGYKQTITGIEDIIQNKHLNVDLLMSLAAIGACIIGDWLEGAMLTFIFCLSNALEEYTTNKSQKEIKRLLSLKPQSAILKLADGQTKEVSISELTIGDVIQVPKGIVIPIDGIIQQGSTTINESAITGEAIPVEKKIGDEVLGGTLNVGQSITVTINKKNEDTTFAKIIQLVEEAQNTPSQTSTFIEKIEGIYVKCVLLLIPLVVLMMYFILHWSIEESFYRGIVLLVVASPCALVASATPATLAAISNDAKRGVLFKGGLFLENLASLKAIAFDKTGTLTKGTPIVTDTLFLDNQQEAIEIIYAIECHSIHPLAQAIVKYFEKEVQQVYENFEVNDITGYGMEAVINQKKWQVGKYNQDLLIDEATQLQVKQLQQEGKTVIFLSKEQQLVAIFALFDVPKKEANEVLTYLKSQNIHITMLTGDQQTTAETIAKILPIDTFYANCLPEEKTTLIQQQKKQYKINAMVGDGINDAPALANAAIGVAMGEGTDIAIDVADVVLMKNDLNNLKFSHMLSKKLKRIVIQNILFSSSVILLLILSNILQLINLPLGVVGHEGSTILVILNGLRLLKPISAK